MKPWQTFLILPSLIAVLVPAATIQTARAAQGPKAANEPPGVLSWVYENAPLPNGPSWVRARYLRYESPEGRLRWQAEFSPKRRDQYHYGASLDPHERPPALIGVLYLDGKLVIADLAGLWVLDETDGKTLREDFLAWPGPGDTPTLWFDRGTAEVFGAPAECKRFEVAGARFAHICGRRLFYFNGYHAAVYGAYAHFKRLALARFDMTRDRRPHQAPGPGDGGEIVVGSYRFRLDGEIFIK